ncbi:hypothetical protein Nepgr_013988 [Nepenthes gracilis]|uniref:Syndetin n=1 Tax=Nepenthes gracilis TaxID=150966 RepID=A0AAD3XP52_NEPGR|nr:hypothetical protein Nepgr_013988 [Nepenthes gracilis]
MPFPGNFRPRRVAVGLPPTDMASLSFASHVWTSGPLRKRAVLSRSTSTVLIQRRTSAPSSPVILDRSSWILNDRRWRWRWSWKEVVMARAEPEGRDLFSFSQQPDSENQLQDLAMALLFGIGYAGIIFEESLAFNKSGVGLLMAVSLWGHKTYRTISEIEHASAEVSGIVLFLLGAMTIVEVVDAHQGFKLITEKITIRNSRTLLWVVNAVFYLYWVNGELSSEGFNSSRVLFLASLWSYQGIDMDLSKVGDKILSSVRSARSLGLLPSTSDRPEVPARAAAAAAVARALAALPPHQRHSLPSSSEELSSMYESKSHGQIIEELEEEFYKEEFDPVKHVLEQIPSEENELEYFEQKATLRLAQLDRIAECLSRHVMEHHEQMVKGMHLVREVERDLKIATIVCKNGRRHLTSSMNEVSRDLIVTSNSKKKQALLDMLPILTELRLALTMQKSLELHVEEGNYFKAFQVLSEYLQLLDNLSELSAVQEMSHGVEVWLGKTLQKLDALLLQVCQEFKEEKYITVVDAYALVGDVSGLSEKIQSFFMQEALSETHSVLKHLVQEDLDLDDLQNRLTYSDLCLQIPESKFRQCLLSTLAVLFKLMCSYYAIMSFQLENKVSAHQAQDIIKKQNNLSLQSEEVQQMDLVSGSCDSKITNGSLVDRLQFSSSVECATAFSSTDASETNASDYVRPSNLSNEVGNNITSASGSEFPWYELRKDATGFVSQSLQRGCKNLWQLMTSRVSILLSSTAFCSTSIHQFLKNYEDLNVFILAGEAFCGVKAVEFKNKLMAACERYFISFHRQNIHALKMVLEKENWQNLPADAMQVISFTGLVGDGASLIPSSDVNLMNDRLHQSNKLAGSVETWIKNGFSHWLKNANPFLLKISSPSKESHASTPFSEASAASRESCGHTANPTESRKFYEKNSANGGSTVSEDEDEDLLADFIDEDSQLPSRISKPSGARNHSSLWKDVEVTVQTGSSLCLLRFMDKYARLMQKLEIVNVEFFKGIQQLFEVYYHFVFETFGQQNTYMNGKSLADSLNYRLKTALNRITHDCDQWIKSQLIQSSSFSHTLPNTTFKHMDVTPASPSGSSFGHSPTPLFGLKERCTGAETISHVAQILHRSKPHLQQMLLRNNAAVVDDFFVHLVDSVPDLIEHIHRTTARLLLHINGYIDRIVNAKWELKDLGMEHNGYVDLLLGEFKHYRTRLAHGGINKEVQELLLDYGVEIVAETLVEGLSRVKRCTDEGRALMSLDLQVLINGLQHFVSKDVKPKLQIVETFIKAYYLPETEYVHWARTHPEYSKAQIISLVNLVATAKGWKRKSRLEILEKIE